VCHIRCNRFGEVGVFSTSPHANGIRDVSEIADALPWAEEIMKAIDELAHWEVIERS
jgi:hypothetical protein